MNQQRDNRRIGHRWQPGESGNPQGRPKGARQKLSETALQNMLESWGERGPDVLNRLAVSEPGTYAKLAFSIIPKDVAISVEQRLPHSLDAEDWALMLRVLDIIKACVPEGTEEQPAEIFGTIEQALRARFAKPITAQSVQPVCIDAGSKENSDKTPDFR